MTSTIKSLYDITGSQAATARLLGVTQAYVSRVMAGDREPSETVETLARILVEHPGVLRKVTTWRKAK